MNFDEMILKLVSTNFYEHEKITVIINGETITRRVYWDNNANDLYIIYKNYKIYKSDFNNAEIIER